MPNTNFDPVGSAWGVAVQLSTGNVFITAGFQDEPSVLGAGAFGPNRISVYPANLSGTPTVIYPTFPTTILEFSII
jgi:hypothetical protein